MNRIVYTYLLLNSYTTKKIIDFQLRREESFLLYSDYIIWTMAYSLR
jgi:hypothetical protein